MSATRELAEWALSLSWSDIPSSTQDRIKEHLADGIGNAIGGIHTDVATAALATVAQSGVSNQSSLWGSSIRTTVSSAAFYNAILIHALDFDDTHAEGLVHATAPTLPVAWALGESLTLCGEEVVTAYAIGIETICRLGMASPHGFHSRGLHATQVCGAIASALTASKLMKLSLNQMVNAMGIAGSFSGGLLEFLNTGSSTKQIHPGIAAQAGITAAILAKNLATGPETVLEGEYGIYKTLSAREFDITTVTKNLGKTWEASQITIKPYPACQLSHVCLDAGKIAWDSALAAGYRVAEIVRITATVHPDSAKIVCLPIANKIVPKSAYDAKFSLPWSLSALLIDGALNVNTFTEISILRPEVRDLASKFDFILQTDVVAAAAASGSVAITMVDGKLFESLVKSSAGGPANRLTHKDLKGKFVNQSPDHLPAGEIFDDLLRIEASPNIANLSAKINKLDKN